MSTPEYNSAEHNHSRRLFLRNTALAGVGLAAAPLLLPTPAEAGGLGGLFAAPSSQQQKQVGDKAAQAVLKK